MSEPAGSDAMSGGVDRGAGRWHTTRKLQGLSEVSIGAEVIERERKPLVGKTSSIGRTYERELKRIALWCEDIHT